MWSQLKGENTKNNFNKEIYYIKIYYNITELFGIYMLQYNEILGIYMLLTKKIFRKRLFWMAVFGFGAILYLTQIKTRLWGIDERRLYNDTHYIKVLDHVTNFYNCFMEFKFS